MGTGRNLTGANRDFVRETFDAIAPRYDFLNRLISLGRDRSWRRRATALLLRAVAESRDASTTEEPRPRRRLGLRLTESLGRSDPSPTTALQRSIEPPLVVDLACGTGDLAAELTKAGAKVVGVDFSERMLAFAHCRCSLVQADVTRLPLRDSAFDGAISGFALRNVDDLGRFLRETRRVLRPGAPLVVLEVGTPRFVPLRIAQRLWLRKAVPVLASFVASREPYKWLGRSLTNLPSEGTLTAALRQAGFEDVGFFGLDGGVAQLLCARAAARTGSGRTRRSPGVG